MAGDGLQAERSGRRADAVANRKRVLDAARDAMADLGINAEIKDIAERAGVGVGTIYRHFEGKDGLLLAIVSEVHAEIDQAVIEGLAADDPLDGLRQFLLQAIRVFERYGWLVDAVLGDSLPPSVSEELARRHEEAVQLTALLERGIAAGALRADLDVDTAARMLVGPLLTRKFGRPEGALAPAEEMVRILDVFLHGAAR